MKRELPLDEHPQLELETDFAMVFVLPALRGQKPFVEVVAEQAPLPNLEVSAGGGTTRVRVDGMGRISMSGFGTAAYGKVGSGRSSEPRRTFSPKSSFTSRSTYGAAPPVGCLRPLSHGLSNCDFEIRATAGALDLEDVAGKLALGTEAGRIDGRGLAGSISATTSAGAIRLELLSLDPGRHHIQTNMGAAIVELARGLPVQIETRTAMGSSRVNAVSTRGADAVLEIEADVGAIRVMQSRRDWTPRPTTPRPAREAGTPYRTAPAAIRATMTLRFRRFSVVWRTARSRPKTPTSCSVGWAGVRSERLVIDPDHERPGPRAAKVCGGCGARYALEAWQNLEECGTLEAHDVRAAVMGWPDDAVIDLRRCATCAMILARRR